MRQMKCSAAIILSLFFASYFAASCGDFNISDEDVIKSIKIDSTHNWRANGVSERTVEIEICDNVQELNVRADEGVLLYKSNNATGEVNISESSKELTGRVIMQWRSSTKAGHVNIFVRAKFKDKWYSRAHQVKWLPAIPEILFLSAVPNPLSAGQTNRATLTIRAEDEESGDVSDDTQIKVVAGAGLLKMDIVLIENGKATDTWMLTATPVATQTVELTAYWPATVETSEAEVKTTINLVVTP